MFVAVSLTVPGQFEILSARFTFISGVIRPRPQVHEAVLAYFGVHTVMLQERNQVLLARLAEGQPVDGQRIPDKLITTLMAAERELEKVPLDRGGTRYTQ